MVVDKVRGTPHRTSTRREDTVDSRHMGRRRKRTKSSSSDGAQRTAGAQQHAGRKTRNAAAPAAGPRDGYAFVPDSKDHCETSPTAYMHLAPMLNLLALKLAKKPSELAIYDPYFCAGSVTKHLAALGFANVYNTNEDFYAVAAAGAVPPHDVVVTNPPYTGNHVERLLTFLATNSKPLCILMPNYFADDGTGTGQGKGTPLQRANYAAWMKGCNPIFLCPRERYQYWTPHILNTDSQRQHSLHLGHKTVPFISYWHIVLAPVVDQQQVFVQWRRSLRNRPSLDESEDDDSESGDELYHPENVVGGTAGPPGAAASATKALVPTPAQLLSATLQSPATSDVLARSESYAGMPKLQLSSDCGLFDTVAKVASSGWGRGGWPHRGAWVSRKKRKAGNG
eukprot:COSAG02_NODE_8159_length_2685_cov_18.595901_2_plen_396_part_00